MRTRRVKGGENDGIFASEGWKFRSRHWFWGFQKNGEDEEKEEEEMGEVEE